MSKPFQLFPVWPLVMLFSFTSYEGGLRSFRPSLQPTRNSGQELVSPPYQFKSFLVAAQINSSAEWYQYFWLCPIFKILQIVWRSTFLSKFKLDFNICMQNTSFCNVCWNLWQLIKKFVTLYFKILLLLLLLLMMMMMMMMMMIITI